MRRALLVLLLAASCTSGRDVPMKLAAKPDAPVEIEIIETGTDALLVSVDAAPVSMVLWTGGTKGTWGRSLDGGRTWTMGTVPGADTLQFRDVEAFSETEAVLLSIGSGAASRLYTTQDGGASWSLRWTNPEPEAFYDCMAFFDRQHGFAFSDAVGTRLPMIETGDGGVTWTPVPEGRVPAARPGEGGYASSGTCAAARADRAWIVTNGGDGPDRVFYTTDRGKSWQVVETPIHSDDGGRGLATLAVGQQGIRAGLLGEIDGVTLLASADGGKTWQRDGATVIDKVYGLAAVPGMGYRRAARTRGRSEPSMTDAFVAVGPGGIDVQRNLGPWQHLTDAEFWGVTGLTFSAQAKGRGQLFDGPVSLMTAVAVGRDGRVALVRF